VERDAIARASVMTNEVICTHRDRQMDRQTDRHSTDQSWGRRPRPYDKTDLRLVSVLVLQVWSWSYTSGLGLAALVSVLVMDLILSVLFPTQQEAV